MTSQWWRYQLKTNFSKKLWWAPILIANFGAPMTFSLELLSEGISPSQCNMRWTKRHYKTFCRFSDFEKLIIFDLALVVSKNIRKTLSIKNLSISKFIAIYLIIITSQNLYFLIKQNICYRTRNCCHLKVSNTLLLLVRVIKIISMFWRKASTNFAFWTTF